MHFYAVIIGTEILNARREDKHFKFVRDELQKQGYDLFATFIVKDDEKLIAKCFELIREDKDSILFSFGGIGSTPDDLTREIAAKIFTQNTLCRHEEFSKVILDKFGDRAFPNRIKMADIPRGSELIFNPVNNMSGFSLENRFFFVPGFPEMAHPMIKGVISKLCALKIERFRQTLLANTSEETLINQMKALPKNIELSCLPMFKDEKPMVELSLSGYEEDDIKYHFNKFIQELKNLNVQYTITS